MKPVFSSVKPNVKKMRKIIDQAAQAQTLVVAALIDMINAVEVVEADSFTSTICTKPGRCAMGELLFQAGFSNSQLENLNIGGEWDSKVYRRLWDEYKIDKLDVERIMGANDAIGPYWDDHFERRSEEVSRVLTSLAKRKNRVNPYLNRISDMGEVLGPEPTKAEIKTLKKFGAYDAFLAESLQ